MGNVEIPNWLEELPLAPEFRPTDTEFSDPIAYISKIEKEASNFGICKIIPPLPKPSKKYVFSNLNKSLLKRPELVPDNSSLGVGNSWKSGSWDSSTDGISRAVFTTRPKQVGATMMTGPVLIGITQSYLDVLNHGAVPTISSSWQSVEEAECRRAYDSATEVYMASFDRSKPPEEVALREAHEQAVQKSMAAFNASAVGVGAARKKFEDLLQKFFKKAFEDYKRNAFNEAELQCRNAIHAMEKRLRAACMASDAKIDNVAKVLDAILFEYEKSIQGPGKWQQLAGFLQRSFEGPVLELFKRVIDKVESEKSSLALQRRMNEDKMTLVAQAVSVEWRTEQLLAKTREEVSGWMQQLRNREAQYTQQLHCLHRDLNATAAVVRSQGSVGVDPDLLMARDQNRDILLQNLASVVEGRDKVLVEMSRLAVLEGRFRPGSGFNLEEARASLEASFANEAEIVFTTVSSSGRKLFSRLSHGFDMVVIDEAAQDSEVGVLPPFSLGAARCVLVGDPQQLPATVISKAAGTLMY